jgi:signal transduction histidine kinase
MYYTPIEIDGQIVGVLSGVYANTSFVDPITSYFFDDQTPTYLCKVDGSVIAQSVPEGYEIENVSEIFNAGLKNWQIDDAWAAFNGGQNFSIDYSIGSNIGVMALSGLPSSDWVVVRTFPTYIVGPVIQRSFGTGLILLFLLTLVFFVYMFASIVRKRKAYLKLADENKESGQIINAAMTLFDRFAVIDVLGCEYEYRKPGRFAEVLPVEGTLSQLRHFLIDHCSLDDDKARIEQIFDADYLREAFVPGVDFIRFEYLLAYPEDERWTQASIICVARDSAGNATQALFAVQDVDDLRRLEEQSRAALVEATHTAELASQAKTSFLSRMSHDIRTPLNTIMGLVAISSMNVNNPEKLRECFEKIMVTSTHLLGLLNDILDLSKIDSNKLVLSEKDVNLLDVVNQVKILAESQAGAKRLELEFDVSGVKNSNVVCDDVRLRQILTNLVDNAVKYTEAGSVHVRVSEQVSTKPGWGLYTFEVSDTGCGIDPDFLPHLFEPFTREEETATKAKGSGLGMAILKSLVTMMNGTVTVQSTVGVGTHFVVRLGFKFAEGVTGDTGRVQGDTTMDAALDALQARNYTGRRVLLVDDNELGGSVTQYLIESAHLECDRALDGAKAVETVLAHEPGYYNIVFMDLQMPNMNGYEAARKIRSAADPHPDGAPAPRPDLATLPIVALSADAFTDDALRCYEAGMNNHISKPLKIPDLLAIFDEYL